MSVAAKVTVDTEVKTAGWSAGLAKNEKELRNFAKNAESAFKGISFQAGAGNFASTLNAGAQAAAEFATALRTGASAQEQLGQLVNRIPIVGQFKQAGEAIREIVTGEQAAQIQAEKLGQSAESVSDAYREILASQQLMGKYGDLRTIQTSVNATEQIITNLHVANEQLDRQIAEIEGHKNDLVSNKGFFHEGIFDNGDNLSDAQKENLKSSLDQKTANDAKILQAEKDRTQSLVDLLRQESLQEINYARTTEDEVARLKEEGTERALRAEGKRLESQEARNNAGVNQLIRQKNREVEDFANQNPDLAASDHDSPELRATKAKLAEQLQQMRTLARQAIQAARSNANNGNGVLAQEEQDRRNVEGAAQEKTYSDLKSQIAIDGYKQRDAALNASYERQGMSQRSHLAEEEEIHKAYRDRIAEIEKTHAENNKAGVDDWKLYAGMMDAAAKEAAVKNAGLSQSSAQEKQKNELEHAHELAKAWESTGDSLKKYEGHLADIYEREKKLRDVKLRDAEIAKLDADTLRELKSANEDHSTKIDLYGRTNYDYIPAGHDAGDAAAQQLELMKAQAAKDEERVPTWNNIAQWFQNAVAATGVPPVEIGIDAIGG